MRKILFFTIISSLCFSLSGQMHEENSKITEFGYLFTNTGHGIHAGFSMVNKAENMHRYSLSYDFGDVGNATTKYNVIKADYVYLFSFYMNRLMYFNAGGGGFISCELLSNKILDMKKGRFSPGACIMFEFEVYHKHLGFGFTTRQMYRPFSIIGDWEYRFEFGLKYVIFQ